MEDPKATMATRLRNMTGTELFDEKRKAENAWKRAGRQNSGPSYDRLAWVRMEITRRRMAAIILITDAIWPIRARCDAAIRRIWAGA